MGNKLGLYAKGCYILVEWRDSVECFDQASEEEFTDRPSVIRTVGFCLKDSRVNGSGHITLARDSIDFKDCRGVIVIPEENIQSISILRMSQEDGEVQK